MKSSRRELLLLCLAGAAGGSLSLTPAAARAAARDELVGTWLVENSADKHEWKDVQSLTLQADGSAIKRFKSSTFAKRWSLSKGKLVIADVPGMPPGPSDEFVVSFADPAKRQLRLKNSYSSRAKEIRLAKDG